MDHPHRLLLLLLLFPLQLPPQTDSIIPPNQPTSGIASAASVPPATPLFAQTAAVPNLH